MVGEQAVAAWVSRSDEAAIRYSPRIDILLNRSGLESAISALTRAGFEFRNLQGLDVFVDGPEARGREAIVIVYAGERSRADDRLASPGIGESLRAEAFQLMALEPLVKMKLDSFRVLDRVNLRDLIDVGLLDRSWLPRLPATLSDRLKQLLDDPEG